MKFVFDWVEWAIFWVEWAIAIIITVGACHIIIQAIIYGGK